MLMKDLFTCHRETVLEVPLSGDLSILDSGRVANSSMLDLRMVRLRQRFKKADVGIDLRLNK